MVMAKSNARRIRSSEKLSQDTESTSGVVVNKKQDLSNQDKPNPKVQKIKKVIKKPLLFGVPSLVLIIVVLMLLPISRYDILGSFLKQNYKVELVNTGNSEPVIGAKISVGSVTSYTNNNGIATLKVNVGHHIISINKPYYSSMTEKILVPIRVKSAILYKIKATGIAVPIRVINPISNSPVTGAIVSVANSTAKTNKSGNATIVLPLSPKIVNAEITSQGYVSKPVSITVSGSSVAANDFSIVPTGKVYFLSNASGTVDVMSANLDGSDPQVVKATTGQTIGTGTILVQSDDANYLALLENSAGTEITSSSGNVVGQNIEQTLYVINTNTGSSEQVNSKADSFNIIGWSPNDHLIYQIYNGNIPQWETGTSDLMTYNASDGISSILSASQGIGTSLSSWAHQIIGNVHILANNTVFYSSSWFGEGNLMVMNLPGQNTIPQQTVDTIDSNASDQTTLLSVPADNYTTYSTTSSLTSPDMVAVQQTNEDTSGITYYLYSSGQLTPISLQKYTSITTQISPPSPKYMVSPSDTQLMWSEQINGHTAIFVSSIDGNNQKQIATLDPTYAIYGWTNENYILVSNDNNELFVMPATGISSQSDLYKITNYFAN